MVVVAAACRKALVNDGWAICLLSCTNGCGNCSFRLVGIPFLAIQAVFSPEEHSPIQSLFDRERIDTNEIYVVDESTKLHK